MTERQTQSHRALVAAFSTELRKWLEEGKSGTLTMSVTLHQGGVRDNRFTVQEERKVE